MVAKVLFERGVFGGRERIRCQAWVRNICNDPTDSHVKISFSDLGRAVWIEGGVAAGETRESASYYIDGDELICCGTRVIVDPDNDITEIKDDNNSCNASTSLGTQSRKETICWHGGTRCIDPRGNEGPRIPDPRLRRIAKLGS